MYEDARAGFGNPEPVRKDRHLEEIEQPVAPQHLTQDASAGHTRVADNAQTVPGGPHGFDRDVDVRHRRGQWLEGAVFVRMVCHFAAYQTLTHTPRPRHNPTP